MPKAYVRVWVEGGKEEAVKTRVLEVDESVQRVDLTTGEQDLIVLLEAPWFDHILDVVNQRIRRITGVTATSTSFVTEKPRQALAGTPAGSSPARRPPEKAPLERAPGGLSTSEPVATFIPAGRTKAAINRLRELRGDRQDAPEAA